MDAYLSRAFCAKIPIYWPDFRTVNRLFRMLVGSRFLDKQLPFKNEVQGRSAVFTDPLWLPGADKPMQALGVERGRVISVTPQDTIRYKFTMHNFVCLVEVER